jgi:NitT/TauT family transport system permease protein
MFRKVQMTHHHVLRSALSVAGFAIVLLVWCLITYVGDIHEYFLPKPDSVVTTFLHLLREGSFQLHLGVSIRRIIAGFLFSVLVGLPLGLGIGLVQSIAAVLSPLIDAVRYTPVSVFIPLLVLWFGIGDTQKTAIILLGTVPYLAVLVADIVSNVRVEYIDTAYTLGASPWQILTRIVLPYALPGIGDALRVSFGIAWTQLLTAELVGATFGLGHFIMRSQRFLQTANIIVGVLVIGLIGLSSDYVFKYAHQHFFRWSMLTTQRERDGVHSGCEPVQELSHTQR